MGLFLKAILIIWLSIVIARFVIRMFLRSAGFTVHVNGRRPQQREQPRDRHYQNSGPAATAKADPNRHVTDNLGDYVDFEEVK